MRRNDKKMGETGEIEDVLRNAEVCRIALCDGDMPYLVPVNFAFHEGAIFIHSARNGRKTDIIGKNNRVCFEAETGCEVIKGTRACDWGTRYRCVIGDGRAVIVEDGREKRAALDLIMRKYSGKNGHTYDDGRVDAIVIIRIDIENLSGKKSGYP